MLHLTEDENTLGLIARVTPVLGMAHQSICMQITIHLMYLGRKLCQQSRRSVSSSVVSILMTVRWKR
jgi:hypothetical protein